MATLQDLAIRILIKQDAIKKDLDKVRQSFEKAWDGIKASAAAAGVAAGAALTSGLMGALDLQEAQAKLAASLGQADVAEQAGRIAGELYTRGWGESMGDVVAAAGVVHSSLGQALDGTDATLSRLTERALAFAKAFDVEVGEAARNAGILITNGLAKDAAEAFDLMVAGMQQVPAHLRDEVMEATEEYSQFLAQVGLDGAEAFGIITSAANYAGKYGIDKAGDALKEFTIRATDMSQSTVDAFETIGLDAQTMAEQLLAGGSTARQAFGQIVAGLREIEDPVLQSNTSIALFGTMLEDLGTGNIPQFLASLDPANSKLLEVGGAADQMAQALEDGQSPLKQLGREIQAELVEKMESAVPYIRDTVDWLREHKAIVGPLAVALGVFAGVVGTIIVLTKVWAAVQTALNIVMMMNPIGLIVLAIIALIAIFVILWNKCEGFRNFWKGLWEGIKSAALAVGRWFKDTLWGEWLSPAFTWIGDKASSVFEFFKELPGKIGNWLRGVKDTIIGAFKSAFNWVTDQFNKVIAGLNVGIRTFNRLPGPDIPEIPLLPKFHDGGIVPGRGEVPIMAAGGEGVFTREQMRALGTRGETTIVLRSDGSRGSMAVAQLFAEFLKGQSLQVVTR